MTQPILPIRFAGTGSYVPDEVVTNEHFAGYLDTSDEWITARSGIKERRRAAPDQCTSTLSTLAARQALDDAGMSAKDLDLIICATATGDCPFPSTATFIQAALDAPNAAAFDVGAACAGFLHAMHVAAGFISAGMFERILVVGAETLSRFVDPYERGTAVLFGDAAGAAVVTKAFSITKWAVMARARSTFGCPPVARAYPRPNPPWQSACISCTCAVARSTSSPSTRCRSWWIGRSRPPT